jgi:hypothetical protein
VTNVPPQRAVLWIGPLIGQIAYFDQKEKEHCLRLLFSYAISPAE